MSSKCLLNAKLGLTWLAMMKTKTKNGHTNITLYSRQYPDVAGCMGAIIRETTLLKRGLQYAIPQVERELHLAPSPESSGLYGSGRFNNWQICNSNITSGAYCRSRLIDMK